MIDFNGKKLGMIDFNEKKLYQLQSYHINLKKNQLKSTISNLTTINYNRI